MCPDLPDGSAGTVPAYILRRKVRSVSEGFVTDDLDSSFCMTPRSALSSDFEIRNSSRWSLIFFSVLYALFNHSWLLNLLKSDKIISYTKQLELTSSA